MGLVRWSSVGVVALGMLAAVACGGDDKKDDDGGSEESDAPVGPSTGALCDKTVTYETDIKPIMTAYCVRCHAKTVTGTARYNAPTDHNFETESGIADEALHADEDAASGPKVTNVRMPPVTEQPQLNLPVPTTAERVTLGKWLACQM